MTLEIKNLMYQPLTVLLTNGKQDSIKPRKKRYFKDNDISQTQINFYKKKQMIKIKEIN